MGKRIITTENLEEDIKIEGELRPQHLDEYIGQEKAKQTLGIYIEAAKQEARLWTMCCFMVRRDLARQLWQASLPTKWGSI